MAKRSREVLDLEESSSSPDYKVQSNTISSTTPGLEAKLLHLDPATSHTKEIMHCSLPGHHPNLPFTTFSGYDLHYAKSHVNRCAACNHNFPTPHILSLHQTEFHDPLAQVLRSRGEKIYKCFVEDCEKVCMTPRKRISHLMDKHGFPKNYEFAVVREGVDGKRTLLREERPERTRRTSLTLEKKIGVQSTGKVMNDAENEMDVDRKEIETVKVNTREEKLPRAPLPPAQVTTGSSSSADEGMEMDDLVGAMSALRFVPPSVRFGKGKGRPKSNKN